MRDLTDAEWDEVELARDLQGFRWMPGMLTNHGQRLGDTWDEVLLDADRAVPDVRDPATEGCLMALLDVVEASHVSRGRWYIKRYHDDRWRYGGASDSLGLALVRCALDCGRWGSDG